MGMEKDAGNWGRPVMPCVRGTMGPLRKMSAGKSLFISSAVLFVVQKKQPHHGKGS
ncbi:hypothetical protein [Dialister succinatiphilus]|uniref:hypothetical protein n=1 Tax=Dialister succinatiphilus TaxID=487173 RepID=UPI001CA315B6|nr:hypothetical protein [Dialister succinatiphilus]